MTRSGLSEKKVEFRVWDESKIRVRKGSKGMYKQNGYILAKAPYHPNSNKRGYVPLHRLIIENHLGRYLEPRIEIVHHIDGDRSNNDITNLKLTTPKEHFIEEHFERRNPNGQFVAADPAFGEIKFRLFDRDKNLIQIYTLRELISKTYRRAKFEFRGSFTGLHDKNGVEIYEGDVVEYTRIIYADCSRTEIEDIQEPITGEVYYAEGLWLGIKFIDGTGKLFLPGQLSIKEDNPELEVIGNIYQHPHLLERS